MIVCLRTVAVPADQRDRYLAWIAEGRAVREAHGILAEWVLEPSDGDGAGDTVVVTVWPSRDVFEAWIATPIATPSPPRRSTGPSSTGPSPATTPSAATPPSAYPRRSSE